MTIPKYDEIFKHALEFLKDGSEKRPRDFELPLAEKFNLTDEELKQLYPSGNGPVFFDRIGWALSYLKMAGLVEKPRRGIYKISQEGLRLLVTPQEVETFVFEKLAERDNRKHEEAAVKTLSGEVSELTPQERLYESYESIRQSSYEEIIDTILKKSSRAFEHLVVKLLEKMGYGGEVKGAGVVTQASNDGGIDGVIKEDVLGLGRIHIQAKRYDRSNTVGREEIQKFVGALAVARSNKGVFITTSSYTAAATQYADSLNGSTTLILIDGQQLAKYIYDYSVGMQTEQVIEIKKMDSDYWDSMQDA